MVDTLAVTLLSDEGQRAKLQVRCTVLSVREAISAVLTRVGRLASESIPLDQAHHRVLARDVVASRALPGFDQSAMDGYAVRAAELPGTFAVVAIVGAGDPVPAAIAARSAVRIFTGAPLPPELDTVVIQEDAVGADQGAVSLPQAKRGDNVRHTGDDIAIGDRVASAGTVLHARHLGALAAIGCAELTVARRPRVALIATGDELVDVATSPRLGQVVDSSAHALAAAVADAGGLVGSRAIVGDVRAQLASAIAEAIASHDVVITTGGVSVGDRDHVRDALVDAGVALELWKVAMKPGKPFTFGRRGEVCVFGLPGNPVSSMVAFELFVAPALRALQGAREVERPRAVVRLVDGYRKPAGRAHYVRATVERAGSEWVARLLAKQGSGMWSSLAEANALVEVAAEQSELSAGDLVPALLLEPPR